MRNNITCIKWSDAEVRMLLAAQKLHGNDWVFIQHQFFPNRNPNQIKCKHKHLRFRVTNGFFSNLRNWFPPTPLFVMSKTYYNCYHLYRVRKAIPIQLICIVSHAILLLNKANSLCDPRENRMVAEKLNISCLKPEWYNEDQISV